MFLDVKTAHRTCNSGGPLKINSPLSIQIFILQRSSQAGVDYTFPSSYSRIHDRGDPENSLPILFELEMEPSAQDGSPPQHLNPPTCVYISKQSVFEQALQLLSLKIHETRVCDVGNNQIVGSVCIDVSAHREHPILHRKKFFGDYKLTEEDALESARLAALLYLKHAKLILVDDINLSSLTSCETKLKECQHRLLAASSWATLFKEQAESLKIELEAAREENKQLLNTAKMLDIKEEAVEPLTFGLKTDGKPLQTTPPPANGQPGSSGVHRGKKRTIRRPNTMKTLFKN